MPKIAPMEVYDIGVMGAFRLDSADVAPDVIPLVEGMDGGAIMQGDGYVINVVLNGSNEIENLIQTGVELIITE